MHELSIALSLLDLVEEEAERRGERVLAIHLKLGPLSGVVAEALVSAFELAREGTPLEQVELVVREVAVTAFCPSCAAERVLTSFPELRCPVCDGPTPDVRTGRELEVVALEVET